MKIIHVLFFLLALLSSTCHASINDFCVADLKAPKTPSGYPCKPPSLATVEDFVFSDFEAGIPILPYNVGLTTAFDINFPGLNGLGISASRLEMYENGIVPMHTHPGGTELLMMVKGEMTAGFVTPTAVYVKTLKPGDIMVFPQGELHFQVNSGKGIATAFAAYSSQNPGLQLLTNLLFGNNLPSPLVSRVSFLDIPQIQKLKARFGGSG